MTTKRTPPPKAATKPTKASVKPTPKPVKPKKATPPQIEAKPLTPFQAWLKNTEHGFDEFIASILGGGHMADFCKAREIPYTTFYDWVRTDSRRSELYARAREDRAEKFADEIVAISDEISVTTKMDGENVTFAIDAAAVSRNKLRVDSRKWIAAKLKPRVYGDRVQVDATVDHKVMQDDALLSRLAKFGIALPGIIPKPESDDAG